MSIKERNKKINSLHGEVISRFDGRLGFLSTDFYIVLIIILVGLGGFGLGRLSALEESRLPVYIESNERLQTNMKGAVGDALSGLGSSGQKETVGGSGDGLLVASKNGSKYHFPWCSGAQRMKEENKIWFDSAEEARKAGYTPAANCKGLK